MRVRRVVPLLAAGALAVAAMMTPARARAQVVFLDGPPNQVFSTVTPSFAFRAIGLGAARPLLVTIQLSTTLDFTGVVFDSSFATPDTAFTVQITRPLPSQAALYARARARAFAGPEVASTVTGPYLVPTWLTLIEPNSPRGNTFSIRRPLFVWKSARVSPSVGPWRYDVELTSGVGKPEIAVAGLTDTTFRPNIDLQASTSYRWSVRAWLPGGESIRVNSVGSFLINDLPVPATTLLYQNFPNPFPSENSFFTCFWFDVSRSGSAVTLDVLDLRGTLVKRVVPAADGVSKFDAGRYGRGLPGSGSNCDNRFTWDGTATDGRVVAPGIYLARFTTDRGGTTVRRIVFRGR